jgi:hypothetical protein
MLIAVLNAIPIMMIYFTRVLRPRVNRWGKLIILYAWRWRNLPQLGARQDKGLFCPRVLKWHTDKHERVYT